jgi:hypothetical protein
MREDLEGFKKGGSISSAGLSRPLSHGEQQALAMQAKIDRSAGLTHAELAERNLRCLSTDAAMKRPRFFRP